ncbi:MAG: hypothetical protein IKJ65_03400 [Clostridia bacterium]|nr:hypothetical protein [Clostridia bacterium]
MIGRIIGFFSCALCALAFWGIAASGKNGSAPISFWTGDNSLKEKIRDVKAYNGKMALLYKRYAFSYLASGVGFLLHPIAGVVILCLSCTLGICMVYRQYKKYVEKYQ